jgi:glyoxylase I family protein
VTVNHVNIVVRSLERSLAFYEGLLGMRRTFSVDLEGAWIEEVVGLSGVFARCAFVQPDGGGCRIELLEYVAPDGQELPVNSLPHTSGIRHLALEVKNLDAEFARLSDAGVRFLSPPVTVPFRLVAGVQKRLCYCHDPDGVIVELCSHETGVTGAIPAP